MRSTLAACRAAAGASVLAAATLLAASPAALRADDGKPPAADLFTARSAETGRNAAAKLWPAVEEARRLQLFEFAVPAARDVVAADPEHKAARAFLGFAKKDGAWAEDAAAVAKVPTTNFPGKAPPPEEAANLERRWWKEVWPAARAAAASVWSGFADECTKKGDLPSAQKAWRKAVDLAPDAERPRQALGFHRWHGLWLTADQVRAVEAAAVAKPVDADSPVDAAFGAKLSKVASAHFRLESRIPADRLAEIATWIETAYAVHMDLLGKDPTAQVFAQPMRLVTCETEGDWNAWIDKFVPGDKEFYRTLGGAHADLTQYAVRHPADDSDETRRDNLMHHAVHVIDARAVGLFWPVWIDEGLCHLTTVRVQGMTKTWCLAPTKSQYAKMKADHPSGDWLDQNEWRTQVRASALAKDDLAFRTLVTQPFPQQGFAGVMKAWSFADFWTTTDGDRFRTLLPKLKGVAPKDQAAVIEAHFGRGLEAIEDDWRRFVLRTY